MITLKFAIAFLCCSILSCIFFTLGRWTGQSEYKNRSIKNSNIDKEIKKVKNYISNKNKNNDIVEVEYEDVVFDLQKYREEKVQCREKLIENVSNFEWMYSKKDDRLVKVPRDVADLIRYMQKIGM